MYLFVVFKALLAMGSPVADCAASMEAMRTDARSNTYHNPMAISQILPALNQKSYLTVKSKECLNEDGMSSVISTLCAHFRWFQFVFALSLFLSWRVPSRRHSGAGARRSCGGFTKRDQSDGDSGGGDAERGSCCLLCGCAKGQLSVGGPRTSQGEKCRLHVSSYNVPTAFYSFFKVLHDSLHCVIFAAVWQVWEGVQPVGTLLKCGERRASQTERPQILASLLWRHCTQSGWEHTQIHTHITLAH